MANGLSVYPRRNLKRASASRPRTATRKESYGVLSVKEDVPPPLKAGKTDIIKR